MHIQQEILNNGGLVIAEHKTTVETLAPILVETLLRFDNGFEIECLQTKIAMLLYRLQEIENFTLEAYETRNELRWRLDYIIEELQEAAPEGFYFGLRNCNQIGFWKVKEEG